MCCIKQHTSREMTSRRPMNRKAWNVDPRLTLPFFPCQPCDCRRASDMPFFVTLTHLQTTCESLSWARYLSFVAAGACVKDAVTWTSKTVDCWTCFLRPRNSLCALSLRLRFTNVTVLCREFFLTTLFSRRRSCTNQDICVFFGYLLSTANIELSLHCICLIEFSNIFLTSVCFRWYRDLLWNVQLRRNYRSIEHSINNTIPYANWCWFWFDYMSYFA